MTNFWVYKLLFLFILGAIYLKTNTGNYRKYKYSFLSLLFSFFSGLGFFYFYEYKSSDEYGWTPVFLIVDLFPIIYVLEHSLKKEKNLFQTDIHSMDGHTRKIYTPFEPISKDLLGNLNREIQNPVKSIESITEFLDKNLKYELTEAVSDKMQLLKLYTGRISQVFQKIDDFSKISRNETTLTLEIFDIFQLVEDALRVKKSEYKFINLTIINSIEKDLFINADKSKTFQIFHYTISELLITSNINKIIIESYRVEDKESFVKILIYSFDTRFTNEDSKIYSPISRIEDGMNIYNSNSLGLAISKHYIELHGGELWTDPEFIYKNNICFTLPLRVEKREPVAREPKLDIQFVGNQSDDTPFTILVVDDEIVNHMILKSLLTHNNFHIVTVSTGFEALYLIENEIIPDVIIIDINMPEMNGLELTKEVRKKYSQQELPVVLITVNEFNLDVDEIFKYGANDILTKPFIKSVLIHRVSTLMELRRSVIKNKKHSLLEHELSIARKLQVKLLPGKKPETHGIIFESLYIPMTYLAGDFYDYFEDESGIGILLADVTGHGIPAAMVASMLKATFRGLREKISEPSTVMRVINQILVGNDNQFLTAAYIYIDIKKKTLFSANAGHPPVVLLDSNGNLTELKSRGKLIGFALDLEWETTKIKLEGLERIILYTDGIIEIKNFNGELLGESHFFEFLKANMYMNSKDLIETTKRMIYDYSFQVNQEDDLTMLVVDFKSSL